MHRAPTPPPHPCRPRLRLGMALGALAVALAALLLYLPVKDFAFLHFDDGYYVTDNAFVPFGLSWYGLSQAFALVGQFTYWHPMTWLSLMFDAQFFGMDSGAFHLHNAVLHAFSSGLLGLALAAMTGRVRESMMVALIFAVHPMNIESVAWVAERKSTLSTFFWMLALLAYVAHARKPSAFRLGLVALVMALGLLTKPTLVVLPAALLLLDWWPLARFPLAPDPEDGDAPRFAKAPVRRLFLEKIPLFALSAAASALVIASRQDVSLGREVSDPIPLGLRMANIPVSLVKYMYKFLFPQDLTIFYPFPVAIPTWEWAGALALLVALAAAALASARRRPVLAVGGLWFLACMAPMSGVVQTGLWPELADRFIYLPMAGLAMVLVLGLRNAVPRWGRTGHLVPLGLLAAYFAFFTWLQLPYWRDGQILFTRAAQLIPDSSVISNNLAKARLREGNVEGALEQLNESVRLDPGSLWAHLFRGRVLSRMGQWAEAEEEYRKGMVGRQVEPNLLLCMAMSLAGRGQTAEAITQLKAGLDKDPENFGLRILYSQLLLQEQRYAEARVILSELLKFRPRDLNIRTWLARSLAGEGKLDEAEALARAVLRDDPKFAPGLKAAAVLHRARGEEAEAERAEAGARAEEEHFARAFAEIGKEALAAGKMSSAVYHAFQAVYIAPWSKEYADILIRALRGAGRGDEAQEVLQLARRAGETAGVGLQMP